MRKQYLLFFIWISESAFAQSKIELQSDLASRDARIKAESHCVGEERVIFTCKIGKKIVSVCANAIVGANQGYLQYRFGEKRKVELDIPEKQGYKSSMVSYFTVSGTTDFAHYVRFTNGSYSYFVYSASNRGQDDPETGASTRVESSGLLVMKGEQKVSDRRCDFPAHDQNMSEDFWKNGVVILDVTNDPNPFNIFTPASLNAIPKAK